jgi:hypothetical protein
MARVSTVNVVECIEGDVAQVVSCNNDPPGNKEAEELFSLCAEGNLFCEEEIQEGLKYGRLCRDDYRLFIVPSTE